MMTRSYFSPSSTILPPRGGHVEQVEIRPLRPNQDVIIPGMTVKGRKLRFETNKSNYRSRNGFSQSDGIAQFSSGFSAPPTPNFLDHPVRSSSRMSNFFDHPVRSSSRISNRSFGRSPEQARRRRYSSSLTREDRIIPLRRNKEQLDLGFRLSNEDDDYGNFVFISDEEEEKRRPVRGKTPNDWKVMDFTQTDSGLSTDLQTSYDLLFDRHLKIVTELTRLSIHDDLDSPLPEDDDVQSLTESDQLSIIGEEMVRKSFEDVLGSNCFRHKCRSDSNDESRDLRDQLSGMRDHSRDLRDREESPCRPNQKKISFVVPKLAFTEEENKEEEI